MTVAGEEFRAHGNDSLATVYLERAVTWYRDRPTEEWGTNRYREWLGTALYDAGRWEEAEPLATALVADNPDRLLFRGLAAAVAARRGDDLAVQQYLEFDQPRDRGLLTALAARVAMIEGDADRALELLSQAFLDGVRGRAWYHGYAALDFLPVRDSTAYRRVTVPWVTQ